MSGFNDDNLKAFLKKNMPEAPAASRSEYQDILCRVHAPMSVSSSKWHSVFAGLMTFAAGFTAVLMMNMHSVNPPMKAEIGAEVSALEDAVSFDDELELSDVGDDYLSLTASIR